MLIVRMATWRRTLSVQSIDTSLNLSSASLDENRHFLWRFILANTSPDSLPLQKLEHNKAPGNKHICTSPVSSTVAPPCPHPESKGRMQHLDKHIHKTGRPNIDWKALSYKSMDTGDEACSSLGHRTLGEDLEVTWNKREWTTARGLEKIWTTRNTRLPVCFEHLRCNLASVLRQLKTAHHNDVAEENSVHPINF